MKKNKTERRISALLVSIVIAVTLLFSFLIVSETSFQILQKKVIGKSFRHKICELLPSCVGENGSIVVCGDSRAQRQVDVRVLSESSGIHCVNIGIESGDLAVCYSIFREFPEILNNGKNLIVISISSSQANDGALRSGYHSEASFVDLSFIDRARLYKYSLDGLWNMYSSISKRGKDFTRKTGLACCGRHRGTYDSTQGFLAIDQKWDGSINDGYAIPGCPWYRKPRIDGIRWEQIKRIVGKMGTLPSQFVFYAPPVSLTYMKYLHTTEGYAMDSSFYANMVALLTSYPTINFINFYQDSTLGIPDSLFYDPAHLNARGAAVFTEILRYRIKAVAEGLLSGSEVSGDTSGTARNVKSHELEKISAILPIPSPAPQP